MLSPIERLQSSQSWSRRARGISLTQVSRQTRSEYRPLWLQRAAFVVDWHSLTAFLRTFDYGNMRKLTIQYDAEHDRTLRQPKDVTKLVLLGFVLPGLRIHIVDDDDSDSESAAANGATQSFTEAAQFGYDDTEGSRKDTIEVAESREKWRKALLDGVVTTITVNCTISPWDLKFRLFLNDEIAAAQTKPGLTSEQIAQDIGISVLSARLKCIVSVMDG